VQAQYLAVLIGVSSFPPLTIKTENCGSAENLGGMKNGSKTLLSGRL
jgi:hypothetical protein